VGGNRGALSLQVVELLAGSFALWRCPPAPSVPVVAGTCGSKRLPWGLELGLQGRLAAALSVKAAAVREGPKGPLAIGIGPSIGLASPSRTWAIRYAEHTMPLRRLITTMARQTAGAGFGCGRRPPPGDLREGHHHAVEPLAVRWTWAYTELPCRPATYSAVHAVDFPLSPKGIGMKSAQSAGGKTMAKTMQTPMRFGEAQTEITRSPRHVRTLSPTATCTASERVFRFLSNPPLSGFHSSPMFAAFLIVGRYSTMQRCES
jgi:hypothetical protein